jgi:hypothetical protein
MLFPIQLRTPDLRPSPINVNVATTSLVLLATGIRIPDIRSAAQPVWQL